MNDEQRKAFEEWADDKYVLHKDHDGDYMYTGAKCAFEAWQVAQQVKSLEWVEVSDALKVVKTVFGEYGVFISGSVTSAKFAGDDYYSRLFSIEAEAIAAANADYRKRVLSCLVNGGV